MVFIQPTTYALINVTDFPFFVVPLNEIEHVHFERVFSTSKTCDLKIIMKVLVLIVLVMLVWEMTVNVSLGRFVLLARGLAFQPAMANVMCYSVRGFWGGCMLKTVRLAVCC